MRSSISCSIRTRPRTCGVDKRCCCHSVSTPLSVLSCQDARRWADTSVGGSNVVSQRGTEAPGRMRGNAPQPGVRQQEPQGREGQEGYVSHTHTPFSIFSFSQQNQLKHFIYNLWFFLIWKRKQIFLFNLIIPWSTTSHHWVENPTVCFTSR